MAKNGIFELNGKAYDALTGELLGDARHINQSAPVQHTPVRHATTQQPASYPPQHAPVVIGGLSSAPNTAVATSSRTQHNRQTPANHVAAHRPQPTKTLMRRAVKQPATHPVAAQPTAAVRAHSNAIPANHPVQSAKQTQHGKPAAHTVHAARANRANAAPRSQAVQHFRPLDIHPTKAATLATSPAPVTATVQSSIRPTQTSTIPLNPAPKTNAHMPVVHPQPTTQPPMSGRNTMRQRQLQQARHIQHPATAVAAPRAHTAAIAPTQHPSRAAARPQIANSTKPHAGTANSHDLFTQALSKATSHEQPAPHESKLSKMKHKGKKRKRVLSIVASAAIFVSLCGFVALQNRENIQLQIAGAKAGFSVAAPLYKPDGYSLDKLTYSSGSVASLYKNIGSQSFTLTQKKSNWDSQTLLENFVATSGEDYKGYQSNGRTVYVYGDGKATWVNGGIWYQIQGADELTDEQLVKIAASM